MELHDQVFNSGQGVGSEAEEFFITVTYRHRTYRYKVLQLPVNECEEIIIITAPGKTVLLTARMPEPQQGRDNRRKQYSYDNKAVSNKRFMDRVIKAIWQHGMNRAGTPDVSKEKGAMLQEENKTITSYSGQRRDGNRIEKNNNENNCNLNMASKQGPLFLQGTTFLNAVQDACRRA